MRPDEDSRPVTDSRDAKRMWATVKFMCLHPSRHRNIRTKFFVFRIVHSTYGFSHPIWYELQVVAMNYN